MYLQLVNLCRNRNFNSQQALLITPEVKHNRPAENVFKRFLKFFNKKKLSSIFNSFFIQISINSKNYTEFYLS